MALPEELKKEILSNEEKTEEEAKLGESRGQLFVRLPSKITRRLDLKKGQSLRFILDTNNIDKGKIIVEVVK